MMQRLLFVYPFFLAESALEQMHNTQYPPLGLLYVAAAARQAGYTVAVYDGTFASGPDDFARTLDDFAPDAVLFMSLITLRESTHRLMHLARQRGIWVVAGGPDPTVAPKYYLGPNQASVVIRGEADETLIEVLRARTAGQRLGAITGLALSRGRQGTHSTGERPPIADLNSLPLPARDLIDLPHYLARWREVHGYASITLVASRGCPLGCDHCKRTAVGPHFRIRSPENVAAEMRVLQDQYAPDAFRLVDDLDGLGKDWLLALAEAMQAAGVTAPYEGLRYHNKLGELPMLLRQKEVCADRNAWIPKAGPHPHAPPEIEAEDLKYRWEQAALPPGGKLAEV